MNAHAYELNVDKFLILINRFRNKELILNILNRFNKETRLHSVRAAIIMDEYINASPSLFRFKENKDTYVLGMLLHDTGKIYIPKDILEKNERLTEDEMKIMKKHTDYGYNELKLISVDETILDIAKYHHERLDGRGYYGLTEEEIPEISKVAAIIDIYDAITQPRCYKEKIFSLKKTITTLSKDNGLDQEYCESFIDFITNNNI